MRRSYKFLLRPTVHQSAALIACLNDHRELYNAALEHRRAVYRKAGVGVRYGDQSADLKHIRAADADGQGRWSCSSQQATLRRLDKAFAAFFKRVREGRTPGFPVDMGVISLVTTSDGDLLEGPHHLAASAGKLAAAQRNLTRKKRGSKRRGKAAARVAALHGKVRRQRLDGAHKAALALIADYDVIVCEALKITNMTRRAAQKPDGEGGYLPNGGAAKSALNRSILDAGWGVFLRVLAHKAESAGREVIAVNPANTSRTCARCGHCARENRRTQAEFACMACRHTAHADVNAAINILRAGLALRQAAKAA
ncbi:RNA-guided endonuclease InsQ/TnpB family protein [Streptosporangium sp. G11]|uniref:RNA-guided endonuclease InsQ/TnpB family protein n=1 Tax=Streptosporangium sp. G11 TaxID=3436926 RepID=UPI003EC06182